MIRRKIIIVLFLLFVAVVSAGSFIFYAVKKLSGQQSLPSEKFQANVHYGLQSNSSETDEGGGDQDRGGGEKESAESADDLLKAASSIAIKASPGKDYNIGETSENGAEILFAENEKKILPIASLAKLMTALVVFERYDLNYFVAVSEKAMEQEGEQGSLKAGEVFSVKNLLYFTLMESSNRAAYAISEVIGNRNFVAAMNQKALELGLGNTRFDDVTGLSPNSYSTAEDLAVLSAHLFSNYPLFREIIGVRELDFYLLDGTFHHRAVNTNQLLGVNNIVGGKTGWTSSARGCLMIIQKNADFENYVIYVILGAEDRFLEMEKLIRAIQIHE